MLQILSDTVRSTIRAVRRREIENFILRYPFPSGLRKKLAVRLELKNRHSIERLLTGLREYFVLCLDGRDMVLGMPSKGVDAAWHEFILYTRDYTYFCRRAYGDYLHHIPNDEPAADEADDFWGVVFAGAGRIGMELGNTWFLSCLRSGQDPRRPTAAPLLFSLDFELGIGSGRMLALADLAALPIPSGFMETEPGRYRYSAWKNRKKQNSAIWWGLNSGAYQGCGCASGTYPAIGHQTGSHQGGGHSTGGGCGGGHGSGHGGSCGGGGGCGGGGN